MRLVFLFFLLLNVAYFLWQAGYFQEPVTPQLEEPVQPKGVASLTLLRERGLAGTKTAATAPPPPPAESKAPAPKPPAPVATVKPQEAPPPPPKAPVPRIMACFTLGPFTEEAVMAKASEAITAIGAEVHRRQVEQRTPKAYWVYLPPLPSYGAALKKVKELRKKGIRDLFIMGKGEKQNAISLGLFSNKSTAQQRDAEVRALGMKPVMETQYRVTQQDWLDIEVDSKRTTTVATLTAIAEDYQGATLSQRKCE
jgi:hypothetical protein